MKLLRSDIVQKPFYPFFLTKTEFSEIFIIRDNVLTDYLLRIKE